MKIDRILLIIPDRDLRKLYHNRILERQMEPVGVEDVACGLLMLAMDNFDGIVLSVEEGKGGEVGKFLRILRRRKKWARIPLHLVTAKDGLVY